MQREPITVTGKQILEQELKYLKEIQRPIIINELANNIELGNLPENGGYEAAKEEQGLTEARIAEIESALASSYVINPSEFKGDGNIKFGARVMLEDNDGVLKIYTIVGIPEIDVRKGRIPFNSPIARELIGKKVGDQVIVVTPSGEKIFEIKRVEYT